MIVARQHQHTTARRSAGVIGVAQRIAAAIHTGCLAIPQGKHTLGLRARKESKLLRAPNSRRRQVLVKARLEMDVGALQKRCGPPQLLVETTQWRTTIARHIATGLPAARSILGALHEQHAYLRLGAAEVDAPDIARVFVVESDFGQGFASHIPCAPCICLRCSHLVIGKNISRELTTQLDLTDFASGGMGQ